MKKDIKLILILCLYSTYIVKAQFCVGSPKVLDEFNKSKLVVVLLPEADNYNKTIKAYVNKNWKYGAYEFIFPKDLEQYKKRKDLFFLSLKGIDSGYSQNSKRVKFSTVLTISKSPKNMTLWRDKSTIALLQLTNPVPKELLNWDMEENPNPLCNLPTDLTSGYAYINERPKEYLETTLKVLFDVIEEFEKGKIDLIKPNKLANHFNPQHDISNLKKKTLLILESSICNVKYVYGPSVTETFTSIDFIKKIYTNNFIIVNDDELSELIKNDNGEYFYLYTSDQGPAINYHLFDIEKNEMVYFNKKQQGFGATSNVSVFENVLKNIDALMN